MRKEGLGIAAAGFLGMFVCGGPIYLAGNTTSAINLALIFALSPLMVLLISLVIGLEKVNRSKQVIGMMRRAVGRSAGHHAAGKTSGRTWPDARATSWY